MPFQKKGILNPAISAQKFNLRHHLPSEKLADFVEHYWLIDWDLRGQAPFISEVLPHPSVHLVLERGRSGVFGVVRGKYSHFLKDTGKVFGVKFRIGAFYPIAGFPISRLTDSSMSIASIFDVDGEELTKDVLSLGSDEAMIERLETFLHPYLPEKDNIVEELNRISATVETNPEIRKVEDLMAILPYSKRHLQRIFQQYVGVSPKWLIQRYRLHEAADLVAKSADWARLAVDLGYFDQAHFIKDFKAMIGQTPMEYAKAQSLR